MTNVQAAVLGLILAGFIVLALGVIAAIVMKQWLNKNLKGQDDDRS